MKALRVNAEGTVVVSVSGLLKRGRDTVELFSELREDLSEKPAKLIMDLSEVRVVDSMSLGLLVGLYLRCQELDVQFHFVGVSPEVRKLFEATNLDKVFTAQVKQSDGPGQGGVGA
ncbi:MAG: STAS domain-containing protein [Chitinivibrionales bacterium]|nr:STAS domain-containing protein [Chitinivibrionales bacterium]